MALKFAFHKVSLQLIFSLLTQPGPFLCWELAQHSEDKGGMCIDQSTPLGLLGAIELSRVWHFWYCEKILCIFLWLPNLLIRKTPKFICQPSRPDVIWTLPASLISDYFQPLQPSCWLTLSYLCLPQGLCTCHPCIGNTYSRYIWLLLVIQSPYLLLRPPSL